MAVSWRGPSPADGHSCVFGHFVGQTAYSARMPQRRRPAPPEAIAASELAAFVRAHRRSEDDWLISDMHQPGNGSRDCWKCHERWPCGEYLAMARRLGWS